MKSDGRLMQKLASLTRLPAAARMGKVNDLITFLLAQPKVQEEMEKTSVMIATEPTKINTRILGPFDLSSAKAGSMKIDPLQQSGFQAAARNFGFFTEGGENINIQSWVFMVDPDYSNMTDRIVRELSLLAGNHGVQLPRATIKVVEGQGRGTNQKDWAVALESVIAMRPDFIVFLNPRGDESIYAYMKGVY